MNEALGLRHSVLAGGGDPWERTTRFARAFGHVVALGTPIAFAVFYLAQYLQPSSPIQLFTDANTYLAAGERLNAGHDLYRLLPGDRPVDLYPVIFSAPLVSHPPIAVAWRPLAAAPFGETLWIAACWVALLATIALYVRRLGWVAVFTVVVLSPAIGQQLAVANVTAFFPLLLTVAWLRRDDRVAGIVIAIMTLIKIAPLAAVGWLLGTRRTSALRGFVVAFPVLVVVALVGAGLDNWAAYRDVAITVQPSPMSISGITGQPIATYAFFVIGTVLAFALGPWPRVSFVVAVMALTLGTPSIYLAALVPLLAVLAPLLDRQSAESHGVSPALGLSS